MNRAVLALVVTAGCGRVAFDAIPPDAAEPGFGAAQPLSPLNTEMEEDDPALSADQLELYFGSNRAGGAGASDLYRSTRPTSAAAFGAPALVAELSTSGSEGYPVLSDDGLTIWFSRESSIYVSTRPSPSDAWRPAQVDASLGIPGAVDKPGAPFAGGLRFVLEGELGGDRDLYLTSRGSTTASWSEPVRIAELTTPDLEAAPSITADGLALYFYSDRDGTEDLWVARRAAIDAPFAAAVQLDELNTPGRDNDPQITSDERVLVFARNFDLQIATR